MREESVSVSTDVRCSVQWNSSFLKKICVCPFETIDLQENFRGISINHPNTDVLFEWSDMRSGKFTNQTYTPEIIHKSRILMFFRRDIFYLLSDKPRSMGPAKCQHLSGIDFSGDNSAQVWLGRFCEPQPEDLISHIHDKLSQPAFSNNLIASLVQERNWRGNTGLIFYPKFPMIHAQTSLSILRTLLMIKYWKQTWPSHSPSPIICKTRSGYTGVHGSRVDIFGTDDISWRETFSHLESWVTLNAYPR
jgi:hypothetical protein